jgi:hypothetical protein
MNAHHRLIIGNCMSMKKISDEGEWTNIITENGEIIGYQE